MTCSEDTPLGWTQIEPYFDRALDMPSDTRRAWLAELATTEPAIAHEVGRLLEKLDSLEADGFLAGSPLRGGYHADLSGQRVGAYTVERLLGRGGMGEVWLASRSDGRFEARCAIKFLDASIRADRYGERFRREGLLLARLAHPNIARLIDAGATPAGRPYLVIEYVDGESLDRYCAARTCSVDERVRLFADVVAAIAHAHSNLIVHRDLKPSNVLVTRDGVVKLLDFGIAKLVSTDGGDVDDSLTRLGDTAFTPEYAAPEQLLGVVPSTATDVYQLGMLLYVLLVGRHPWQQGTRSRADRMRAALDARIPRASDLAEGPLRKKLRGDLDAILAMALRKEPQERYATAAALRDELVRYLHREPINARRGAAFYQARKFVQRHRVTVAVSAIAIVSLMGALVYATGQAQRAQAEAHRAQDINAFILSLFKASGPGGGGSRELRVVELLQQSITRIERELADQPERQIELYQSVGAALEELNAYPESLTALDKARAVAERAHLGDSNAAIEAQIEKAAVLVNTGELAASQMLLDDAEKRLRGRPLHIVRAKLLEVRSFLQLNQRSVKQALASAAGSVAIYRTLLGEQHPDYVASLLSLVRARYHADDCAHGLPEIDGALRSLAQGSSGDVHSLASLFRGVRARCLKDLNRTDEAAAEFERNDATVAALVGAQSKDYAIELTEHSIAERDRGNSDAAIGFLTRSLAILRELKLKSPNLAIGQRMLMLSYLQKRDLANAAAEADTLREVATDVYGPADRGTITAQFYTALIRGQRGDARAALAEIDRLLGSKVLDELDRVTLLNLSGGLRLLAGDAAGALRNAESCMPVFIARDTRGARPLALARQIAGTAHLALGHPDDARRLLDQARDAYAKLYSFTTPEIVDSWVAAARLELQSGDVARAEKLARDADAFWAQRDPSSRWAGEAAYWWSAALRASGQTTQADVALKRARDVLRASPFAADAQLVASR